MDPDSVGGKDADQLRGRRGDDTLNSVDGLGNDLVRDQGGDDTSNTGTGDAVDGCEA